MQKRGQLSWFILLGILLVMSFLLYTYFQDSEQEGGIQETQQGVVFSESERLQISNFVQDCLEKVTEDGLELLARQGAKIYVSQGGIDPDYPANFEHTFYHLLEDVQIPLLIKKATLGTCVNATSACPQIPQYPWKVFPYLSPHDRSMYANIFGKIELPPLYEADGGFSIEAKLSKFIENSLPTCIQDFIPFKDRYSFTQKDSVNVSLVIALDDFIVNLRYPFEVIKGEKKISFSKFAYKPQIRLRRVYNTTLALMKADTTFADFDLVRDAKNIFAERNHFQSSDAGMIFVRRDFSHPNDLVQIVDIKSTYKTSRKNQYLGKHFTFNFFRENRPPALHYITDGILNFEFAFGAGGIYNPILNIPEFNNEHEIIRLQVKDGRAPGVASDGLLYNHTLALNPLFGNIFEADFESGVIFIPNFRSNLYNIDTHRAGLVTQLKVGNLNHIVAAIYLNATDPDEDLVSYGMTFLFPHSLSLSELYYTVTRNDCCRGQIGYRFNVTDGTLFDYQDVYFTVDKKVLADKECHYDSCPST